jgi:hypothetical protein
MPQDPDALIAELVGELEPVRPMRFAEGLALALAGAGASVAAVAAVNGLRPDLLGAAINPMHLVASGLALGLALAATVTVVVMGRPQIGNDHKGWRWAAVMAGLLPVTAVVVAMERGAQGLSAEAMRHGAECLAGGTIASLLVFAMLVVWLRRGAPTSPARAGLVAGVAAGAFGVFTISLSCGDNDIVHFGLWHSLAVLVTGLAGRALVPRLIRW